VERRRPRLRSSPSQDFRFRGITAPLSAVTTVTFGAWTFAHKLASQVRHMKRQREQRIPMQLPVRLWGMDSTGKLFNVDAKTVDITPLGARIAGDVLLLQPGSVIGVECGRSRSRFRVVWVGQPGTRHHGQIGIRCLEPGKYIWGVPLQRKMEEAPSDRPLPPSISAINPILIRGNRMTAKSHLRKARRYNINTHLKILKSLNGQKKVIPGYARDISKGGMAAFVPAQFAIGERLEIQFAFPGFHENLTVAGIIRTIDKCQYGIEFINLDRTTERIIVEGCGFLADDRERQLKWSSASA
jgi:hypothetical protein